MARREARQGRAPLATDGKTKPENTASTSVAPLLDGRRRVVIESVSPEVDGGRFPVKRVAGETVVVEADVICDGHDIVSAVVLHRPAGMAAWEETPMEELGNDRYAASFQVDRQGTYEYTLAAWVEPYATWQRGLSRKVEAGQDVTVDLEVGAAIVAAAAERAGASDERALRRLAEQLVGHGPVADRAEVALGTAAAVLVTRHPDRELATEYERILVVLVDRERARYSTWYELFPRSTASEPERHGTLADVERRLQYVAELGFDVLYLPPIHPIGETMRKGRNNALRASEDAVGSPWAIGAEEGGHTAVHPQLGTLEDFRRLVLAAERHGIEIALDLAFQCSPDHPYVHEHPEWFRRRPGGGIQYAENPPKRYEDIYPFDFETDAWWELWQELQQVVLFWIEQGVRIFRVDNPHTKPFGFWEWLLAGVKREHPEVLFLSEAFTRPKVMARLAKLGFTQSYTYFAWRNTKHELLEYFTELARSEQREYFRPNVWPNTPDILTEYLQHGGRPAFVARLVLAATLAASYGIYGPAFELGESRPREPGSEEYLDSEKYELRHWDLERSDSLAPLVARMNAIRHENPALQSDWSLVFHSTENEQLLCYSKATDDLENVVLCVVNVDPHHRQSGFIELSLADLGLDDRPFQVHDLLGGGTFLWQGGRNYVELDPGVMPAHVFAVRQRIRSEHDFDYFA
jgi:starch synthase (maltosyl-transferring)